jgi:hypothetical protein
VLRSDPGHEGEWVQAPTRGEYSLLVNSGEKLQVCLARSHCRLRNRGTEYVREYVKWMSGGAKRQCDRTLGLLQRPLPVDDAHRVVDRPPVRARPWHSSG